MAMCKDEIPAAADITVSDADGGSLNNSHNGNPLIARAITDGGSLKNSHNGKPLIARAIAETLYNQNDGEILLDEINEEASQAVSSNMGSLCTEACTLMGISSDGSPLCIGTCELKDPMRDSLMSSSSSDEAAGFSDDDTEVHILAPVSLTGTLDNEHGRENSLDFLGPENSLDLEFDLWEGQFEITRPDPRPTFYRDIVSTVQMLQQQVGVLAENQINSDDRFTRCKQDNATYQARSLMLEEQLRETELRGEDRLSEEQRRNKELIARIEREKQLTIENYTIKLASLDKEKNTVREENQRLKPQLEKLQKDKEHLEDRVSEAEFSASALLQENAKLNQFQVRQKEEVKAEQDRSAKVIEELRCEIERLRAADEAARKRSPSIDPQAAQNIELQSTIKHLREDNKSLTEQVEDLQAQLLTTTLEEGRTLVNATNNNSLAAEFEQMTNEEGALYGSETVEKLKKSLKKEQEANVHLRTYIDGILINIVENYPQLLEIKQK